MNRAIKDAAIDVAVDFGEPAFDDLTVESIQNVFGIDLSDIAEITPGLKSVVFASKLYDYAQVRMRAKKMIVFLNTVREGKADIDMFLTLPENEKQDIRAFLLSELDKQTSENQSFAVY